jgi:hypothetical protein
MPALIVEVSRMKRALSFTLIVSVTMMTLPGCSLHQKPDPDVNSNTVGNFHNDGVQFVLTHLDSIPDPSERTAIVRRLTNEYLDSINASSPDVASFPSLPAADPRATIAGTTASPALKSSLNALVSLVEAASPSSLSDFESNLSSLRRESIAVLDEQDFERFSSSLSVAKASGRFWAQESDGGLGGTKFIPGDASERTPEEWVEVVTWDIVGCAVGGFCGFLFLSCCLAFAVAASVTVVLIQESSTL